VGGPVGRSVGSSVGSCVGVSEINLVGGAVPTTGERDGLLVVGLSVVGLMLGSQVGIEVLGASEGTCVNCSKLLVHVKSSKSSPRPCK